MSVVSTLSGRGIVTISLPFFSVEPYLLPNAVFLRRHRPPTLRPATISAAASPPFSPPLPSSLVSADDQAWGCELLSFAGGVWWKKSEAWGGSSLLIRDKETHLIKRSHMESRMQNLGDFKLPHFFNYPPYFTLQPVRETREKQIQLWKELILEYCKNQKIFIIGLEQEFPLFTNSAIERSLSHEAREAFLSALVSEGRAEWMDKSHRKCLILWLRIQDWADCILHFVKDNGFEDSVMSVDDLRSGIETRGSELEGIDRIVLMRALKLLEQRGKCAIFKGNAADDEGVKFSV